MYRFKRGGDILRGGVDFGRVVYRFFKWVIFWEGVVYSGMITYICLKERGIFREGRVDSGRIAYRCLKGGGVYSQ